MLPSLGTTFHVHSLQMHCALERMRGEAGGVPPQPVSFVPSGTFIMVKCGLVPGDCYENHSSFAKLACLQSVHSTIRRQADGYGTEIYEALAAFVKAKLTDFPRS